MENSLDSSPESTTSGPKALFKKPKDLQQAFQVSMEESYIAPQGNKSDIGLDTTSDTNKALPFKKPRKSVQPSFNVSSGESLVNNESEQSVTFTKPQQLFSEKDKSLVNFFNVSFNETVSRADALGRSIDCDESVTTHKTNPFSKNKNETQNEVTVQMESSVPASGENDGNEATEELQIPSSSGQDSLNGGEADSTTFVTKPNPFKKSERPENDSISQMQLSVGGQNKTNEEPESTVGNSGVNDSEDLSVYQTLQNPFEQRKTSEKDVSISVTEQRSTRSLARNVLNSSAQNSGSFTVDKSISKMTSNASVLEQSSINDDNLNNWMSDQSDDDLPPPTIPSVTANLSATKDKQAVPSPPPTETNPMSVWELKLSEIVSKAEKKSLALKARMTTDSPKKANPLKKSKVNVEKPALANNENFENKYKPPKLLKPASFATKQLYAHIIRKLEPKYGIDTVVESENLVSLICDTVKKVTRRKTHQKRLIQNLKKEMAKAGLIETTIDFHEFIIKFLPYSFRVKVVPCLQPVTNMVYPPKDVTNPFDKVL